MISFGNGGTGPSEPIGKVNEVRETPDGVEADIELNERGVELRREALLREEQAEEDALRLLQTELGATEIAEYINKPEYVLIAAVREDPHAFDGMWYPTALSEDGIGMIEDEVMDYQNLFFIRVSTDLDELEGVV